MSTVSIIIPSLGRLHRLTEWLIHTRKVSPFTHCIIVTPDELNATVARGHGYQAIVSDAGVIEAFNIGAAASTADWLAVGSDDFFYLPGWFDAAMRVNTGGYVGLRDAADSSHYWFEGYMISREFAIAHAGGVLAIPAYGSQYGDVEMYARAERAGCAVGTLEIVAEHRHWTNGGAPFDATYQRGRTFVEQDAHTFTRRAAEGFPNDFAPVLEAVMA